MFKLGRNKEINKVKLLEQSFFGGEFKLTVSFEKEMTLELII